MKTPHIREKLVWYGMALFLLGLLVGFASPALRNPRLGLSAHLEGVLNGMFLILVGLIWDRVSLSPGRARLAYVFLISSGFANWLACLLGGIFGASRMTPIAGAGMSAAPWQEGLVAVMFGYVGVAMTAAVALLAWGLRPGKGRSAPGRSAQ